MGSFYDLDYIIEINEKRLEQYSGAYQKILDKSTNIFVIYSAFTIFLVPIIQSLFFEEAECYWLHYVSFYVFMMLFGISFVNAVRLLTPVEVAHLGEPRFYYERIRLHYQKSGKAEDEINKLIKSSYILELEEAVTINKVIFKKKGLFYYRTIIFAIAASIPYLLCIGFQMDIKESNSKKVAVMNNFSTLGKTRQLMQEDPTRDSKDNKKTRITQLPGVDMSQVIPSHPMLVKETLFDFKFRKNKKSAKR